MERQVRQTSLEKIYEELTIPENHFKELMVEFGVSLSKAKVISKSLTLHILETTKRPIHEMNKRFDSYSKRNKKNRDNFIISNNMDNKIDYISKIHKLNLNNLPKSLMKYKQELKLFI